MEGHEAINRLCFDWHGILVSVAMGGLCNYLSRGTLIGLGMLQKFCQVYSSTEDMRIIGGVFRYIQKSA